MTQPAFTRPTSPSSGTNNAVTAFGSGTNENAFLLDGTNFTCPCSGNALAEPGIDTIQEIQIQSVGASAEYGNIQGAVFNIVTRQGGNRLQLDASYFGQPAAWTSQPITLPCAGCSEPETGYERARYRDFTANAGGPILRDRARYLRRQAQERLAERQADWHGWTWRGARRVAAVQAIVGRDAAPLRPSPHGRDCDGAVQPPPVAVTPPPATPLPATRPLTPEANR